MRDGFGIRADVAQLVLGQVEESVGLPGLHIRAEAGESTPDLAA
jgi:hypothetical protein